MVSQLAKRSGSGHKATNEITFNLTSLPSIGPKLPTSTKSNYISSLPVSCATRRFSEKSEFAGDIVYPRLEDLHKPPMRNVHMVRRRPCKQRQPQRGKERAVESQYSAPPGHCASREGPGSTSRSDQSGTTAEFIAENIPAPQAFSKHSFEVSDDMSFTDHASSSELEEGEEFRKAAKEESRQATLAVCASGTRQCAVPMRLTEGEEYLGKKTRKR